MFCVVQSQALFYTASGAAAAANDGCALTALFEVRRRPSPLAHRNPASVLLTHPCTCLRFMPRAQAAFLALASAADASSSPSVYAMHAHPLYTAALQCMPIVQPTLSLLEAVIECFGVCTPLFRHPPRY